MVQFEELREFTSAHNGLFWDEVRDQFPRIQEQPPLPSVPIERAGPKPGALQMQLEIAQGRRTRTWLLDDEERELLQIQHDRFIRNWRKAGEQDLYPRYERHIRPRFEEDFRKFVDFVSRCGLGEIKPVQCEVTYFNRIRPAKEIWRDASDMHRAMTTYSPPVLADLPASYEQSRLQQTFAIEDDGQFIGRLYTELFPVETDGEATMRYHLTVRGRPKTPTIDGVLEFLDLGRRLIVECFERTTSTEMHRVWKKE